MDWLKNVMNSPEGEQGQERKADQWAETTRRIQAASSKSGIAIQIPKAMIPTGATNSSDPGFFESRFLENWQSDCSRQAEDFAREILSKVMFTNSENLNKLREAMDELAEEKDEELRPIRKKLSQSEAEMQNALKQFDSENEQSEKGVYKASGLGCGFGVLAVAVNFVMIAMKKGGFLSGGVLYGVMFFTVMPIAIAFLKHIAHSAKRIQLEQLYQAPIKDLRAQLQRATEAAESRYKARLAELREEQFELEKAHTNYEEAYVLLGSEAPDALKLKKSA